MTEWLIIAAACVVGALTGFRVGLMLARLNRRDDSAPIADADTDVPMAFDPADDYELFPPGTPIPPFYDPPGDVYSRFPVVRNATGRGS